MSVVYQVLSTIIISYTCVTLGIMFTWPSSTYTLFASNGTTLERPMSGVELSLLGSLSSISALVVTPFTGLLLDKLGRKRTFIIFSLVQVLAWVIVVSCNKIFAILSSVFITGITGCVAIIIPMYVGEICQESIRGSMTSLSMTFFAIGSLISYLFGGYLDYHIMNYVSLSLTVLGVLMLTLVKESPVYLMKIGAEKEAAKCLAYYRGVKEDSKEVLTEIENIKRIINPILDDITETKPEEEKLKPDFQSKQQLSTWAFLKKSRSSRQALILTVALYTAAIFQGLVVVQVYAMPLFGKAIPNISATISCVIFAVTAIISGFIGAYLVEKFGRRFLMIYSSLAAGVFCLILGTQIHIHWGPHWLTPLMILFYCVAYCLGAGIVPYVIVAEVFLPEIKGVASMVAVEWACLCNFIVLFIFNPIVSSLGLGPVFYIFATACFLSAIFCIFFLPETKGLTVEVYHCDVTEKENIKRKRKKWNKLTVSLKNNEDPSGSYPPSSTTLYTTKASNTQAHNLRTQLTFHFATEAFSGYVKCGGRGWITAAGSSLFFRPTCSCVLKCYGFFLARPGTEAEVMELGIAHDYIKRRIHCGQIHGH